VGLRGLEPATRLLEEEPSDPEGIWNFYFPKISLLVYILPKLEPSTRLARCSVELKQG